MTRFDHADYMEMWERLSTVPTERKSEFNHAGHVALWDWLANHPYAGKEDWPGWEEKNISLYYDCFACEIGHMCIRCRKGCTEDAVCRRRCACPLDWGNKGKLPCITVGSPYKMWENEVDLNMRAFYARQVRDLPLKETCNADI